MNAGVFILGSLAFLIAWTIHCLWWRSQRPSDDLKALAALLGLFPLLFFGIVYSFFDVTFFTCAFGLLLSWAIGAAYLFWYPAAQAVSPTMLLVILTKFSEPKGASGEELLAALPEEELAGESVDNLFHEQFAGERDDGSIYLKPRGQRTLAIIRYLRSLAGFSEPKG